MSSNLRKRRKGSNDAKLKQVEDSAALLTALVKIVSLMLKPHVQGSVIA
jgi:hypothetical protein